MNAEMTTQESAATPGMQADDIAAVTGELNALNGAPPEPIAPPYSGRHWYVRARSDVFWNYPVWPTGNRIVNQLGTLARHPGGWGFAQIGFRKRFYPRSTGWHKFIFGIDAGPITHLGGAQTRAAAWVGGRRPVRISLPRTRGTYHRQIDVWAPLYAGRAYDLFVVGEVEISVGKDQRAYGEVIANFNTSVAAPYAVASLEKVGSDDFLTRLDDALEGAEDSEAMAAKLAELEPEADLGYEELTLEQAVRFEGMTLES